MLPEREGGTWVWIWTKDADALYTEFAAQDAELRQLPRNYPWGSRECSCGIAQVQMPENPGGDGPPRAPALSDLVQLRRGWVNLET